MARLALVGLLVTAPTRLAAGEPATAGSPGGVETPAPDRERARADLRVSDDVDARRRAVGVIAEVGTMADVPALVEALRDADPVVRALTERALWEVWSRSGDAEIDRLFAQGIEQMRTGLGQAAVATFSRIIELKPDFAEGWNKRATLYYHLGEYEMSLADCDEVIRRNPYHFGALSGYGLNYLALDQPEKALAAFERALDVNPNLGQVQATVELLRQVLAERRKGTI